MTPTRDDGGAAFPQNALTGERPYLTFAGLSTRDYFAAAALQGLLAGRDDDRVVSEERIAKSAYAAADAMIAARKETP